MSAPSLPLITFCLAVCASGCATTTFTARGQSPQLTHASLSDNDDTSVKTIHVVGHGWHTGLVLAVDDIREDIWPQVRSFSGLDHVELGWGDEGFYRAPKITIPLCLRAALWPTPSVVHAAGFRGTPRQFYQASDIVEVQLSAEQFERLCHFIAGTLKHDEFGQATALGPGIYGESVFYRANGSYYFPKTCNVWTARALQEAGLPVRSFGAIRAESVLSQARPLGTVLQSSVQGMKYSALFGN